MDQVTWRDRARYAFDNVMARGTRALIVGLFSLTLVAILLLAVLITITGVADDQGLDFATIVWRNLLRTLDAGTMGGDEGSSGFLGAMLVITLLGIFVTSTLIGIINAGIQDRLTDLRKGRSRVIERDHTLILGWSQQVHTVIAELIVANGNHRGRAIVILAERDPIEMEEEVRARLGPAGTSGTRLVFRSGSPMEVADLAIASVQTSRSIVVLAPETDDPDPDVIKAILAITSHAVRRRVAPYHIVAELQDRANLRVAQMVGRDEVELILAGDVIARIAAQTCRQSGLSIVYQELLDFSGDEIYMTSADDFQGRSYGDVLTAFVDASPIGLLVPGGGPRLNPPADTVIGPGDRLVVIAADDDRITRGSSTVNAVDEALLAMPVPRAERPERTLILGWNRRAPALVRELDRYAPAGSTVTVVAPAAADDAGLAGLGALLVRQGLEVRTADSADRSVLDALGVEVFDHIVVLCESDHLDVSRADARTLITLLHLRDIASRLGRDFSIVSEMLDLRDRALAEVARADDFIVSDRLISLMIAQVSENKHLNAVFADILDPEGSEIYLKPAADYVVTDRPVPYAAVVEAARRRGETAIGYRVAADQGKADAGYGVRLNPRKDADVAFAAGDRVIVLAED